MVFSRVLFVGCVIFSFSTNCIAIDLNKMDKSKNVIDLTGGIPCKKPLNCHAGPLECDTLSCTQLENTGLCKKMLGEDGKIVPSNICETKISTCGNKSTCENIDFPTPPTACINLTCTPSYPVCQIGEDSVVSVTGSCIIHNKGPFEYEETCEIVRQDCNSPAPPSLDLEPIFN